MGKRGPQKTPTSVLGKRGSWRAQVRRGEPAPDAARPPKPPDLDDEESAKWDDMCHLLEGMGLLTVADGDGLAIYCRLWARMMTAERVIKKHGQHFIAKDSKERVTGVNIYPQVWLANKLARQLTQLGREFGLTPSARADLAIETPQRDSISGKSRFFQAA
jgi:P27 family predicted phage terminase small subunit